jgi:uncharacterized protein YpuA (DUF1002 family)
MKDNITEKSVEVIVNKMFEISGHNLTYNNVKDRDDDWYTQWTMTSEQVTQWEQWGKEYLMENLQMNSIMAEKEMDIMSLGWGLKIKNKK